MTAVVSDRRVLAGIRFVDASTGASLRLPFDVRLPRLGFARNRSGLYAVTGMRAESADERALAEHLAAFEAPPEEPAAASVDFAATVSDPSGRYLPRRFALSLPRGDDWAAPIEVMLHPAPSAPLAPNWSGVRASLRRQGDGATVPLVGARLTVIRDSDATVLAHGFSDRRGEVLAVVVGVQIVDFTAPPANGNGDDPPEVGTRTVATRLEIHSGPGDDSWPPDPEAIEAQGQAWEPVGGPLPTPELRTGRVETAGLSLLLQPQT